jgi:hypothetical protein
MQCIQEGPALHLHEQARPAVIPAVLCRDALHVAHKEATTQMQLPEQVRSRRGKEKLQHIRQQPAQSASASTGRQRGRTCRAVRRPTTGRAPTASQAAVSASQVSSSCRSSASRSRACASALPGQAHGLLA